MNTFVASPNLALTIARQTIDERVAQAEYRAQARAARSGTDAHDARRATAERPADRAVPAALVGVPLRPPRALTDLGGHGRR